MKNVYGATALLISVMALTGCVAKSKHHGYTENTQADDQAIQFFDNETPMQDQAGGDGDPKVDPVVPPPVNDPPETNEDTGGEDPPDETPPTDQGDGEGGGDVVPPTGGTASCEANPPAQIEEFVRLAMHFDLLKETAFLTTEDPSNEPGDALPVAPIPYTLAKAAVSGDNAIELTDASTVVEGQLLAYKNANQGLNVVKVASISGNIVSLAGDTAEQLEALFETIPEGQNLWNFYEDYTHPNEFGYQAIADYAVNTINAAGVDASGTHVFLGDSWFGDQSLVDRVQARVPGATVINKGIGGNTLCDLLARFDADVTPNQPKFVWITSSINDYYRNVTQAEFYDRMKELIGKVQGIGATAIVLDAAPGQPGSFAENTTDNADLFIRSQRYAAQVQNLFTETQQQQQ